MNTMNQFLIRGTIIHRIDNTKATILTVATSASIRRNQHAQSDYPGIVFWNPTLVENFTTGDHVTIRGFCRNYRVYAPDGTIRMFTIELVGTQIQRSKRILASYLPEIDAYDGGTVEDMNSVVLSGRMFSVRTDKRGNAYVTLQTMQDGQIQYVSVTCFGRQASYALKEVASGDPLAIAGNVHTWLETRKDSPEHHLRRQNITCLDLSYIPHAEFEDLPEWDPDAVPKHKKS